MYKHILVPTDGSALSRRAIATAVTLAAEEHAKVTGLYVADIMSLATVETNPRQLARDMAQAQSTARWNLGEVEQAARAAGVECETFFEEENRSVPDAIAHITEQRQCDLVVMGTNARHGLAAMLRPSNAKEVAKYLSVPVLVVH